MSNPLKLMALDEDDLAVLSAHVQDAVIKSSEIEYLAKDGLLILPLNRFAWEAKTARRWFFKKYERRRSALHFSRVGAIKTIGINRDDEEQVLELLAVTFTRETDQDNPAGTLEIAFAGGATLRANLECIEAQLTDLGAAWSTTNKPRHRG